MNPGRPIEAFYPLVVAVFVIVAGYMKFLLVDEQIENVEQDMRREVEYLESREAYGLENVEKVQEEIEEGLEGLEKRTESEIRRLERMIEQRQEKSHLDAEQDLEIEQLEKALEDLKEELEKHLEEEQEKVQETPSVPMVEPIGEEKQKVWEWSQTFRRVVGKEINTKEPR